MVLSSTQKIMVAIVVTFVLTAFLTSYVLYKMQTKNFGLAFSQSQAGGPQELVLDDVERDNYYFGGAGPWVDVNFSDWLLISVGVICYYCTE